MDDLLERKACVEVLYALALLESSGAKGLCIIGPPMVHCMLLR